MHQSPLFYRPDVDGLRAVAILGVLFFHAFPSQVPGGFTGVDVFFVISGYVVMHSLMRQPIESGADILKFYGRRVRRLFPALIVTLLACALLGWLVLPTPQLALLGKHMLAGAASVQNWVLWQESGYFDTTSSQKWLLHLWSLGIEEQFYSLLPVLLLMLHQGRAVKSGNRLPVLLVLAAASFALCLWLSHRHPSAGFYLPFGRLWEFLAGAVLACWPLATAKSRHLISALATLGLLATFVGMKEAPVGGWHFPGWLALLPVVCTLVLIGSPASAFNRMVLSSGPFRHLGRISYPLYLWHWPLLAYLNAVDPAMQWSWPRWLAVALAFILAELTYRCVEHPLQTRNGRAWPLVLAMMMVALLGGWLWKHTPPQPQWLRSEVAQAPRWAGDALYRDASCLSNPKVNPWNRHDFFCLGDPDQATWALWGDSHANALSAGLQAAMPGQWLNLGGGGCMPFGGVDSGTESAGLQCPADIPSVFLHYLVAAPNIRTVVVLVRGPLYLEGTGWGPEEAQTRRWLSRDGLKAVNQQTREQWFQAGMTSTLSELTAAGKHVIWLLNTPEMGLNIQACIRPLPGAGWFAPPPACSVSREAYADRSAAYYALVQETVEQWRQANPESSHLVQVLDPAQALCDEQACPLVMHGQTLYRDGDHLSEQGAGAVAQWLLPQLPR